MKRFPTKRGSNYYIEHDGKKLVFPSVTTIINETLPKRALVHWAAETAARAALENPALSVEEAVASIYQRKGSAVDIGKTIHSWAEAYGNGKILNPNELPEDIRSYGEAFKHFADTETPEIIYTECTVFNTTHGYAGTVDQIGKLKSGKLAIFDYKTGKNLYFESHLQQSAYANAEYILTKDKKVLPMPKISEQFLVHLKTDGKHSLVGVNAPFGDFLKVFEVWKVLKREGGR